MTLWIDTETYSETPIKRGTYRYARDCEVMIVTYAFDDGPVYCWDRTADPDMPGDLAMALADPDEIVVAHSSMFDRNVIRESLGIEVAIPRWRDTMVQAQCHGLPGGLDKLCDILKVPQDKAKIKAGRELVLLFCKPRPKGSKVRRATRHTHPEKWAEFLEYAKHDIIAMREVAKRLPTWNYSGSELALWHLDQAMNDRGYAVDLALAEQCIRAANDEQARLGQQVADATDGAVLKATQRDQMLVHIFQEYGIDLPDLTQSTVERRLNDPDVPEGLKELLRIRAQASMSSTAKFKTLINGAVDGRMRGTMQFAGAGRTTRWSGRTFQPQNLPSKHLIPAEDIPQGIDAIMAGCEHLLFDNVMLLLSSVIRGCIVAPPGKKLVVADLSNIEGRGDAWLAGEEWKLQAFREYDASTGPDLYKLAYARSFGIDPADVDKRQRQIGKVQELALARQGGVGAFLTFAMIYDIDLEAMAEDGYATIADDVIGEAEEFYDWAVEQKRSTFGLSKRAFVVCDSFKRLWRRAHSQFPKAWEAMEQNAIDAVQHPGETFEWRRLKFRRDGAWLRIVLPSGRCLCYPHPQVSDSGKLSYMGVSPYSHQWCRIKGYGGQLFGHASQKLAREILSANLPQIDAAGYLPVLLVHDEGVAETPDSDELTAEGLSALLAAPTPWSGDLPLAAKGFAGYRYRKD